MSRSYCKSLLKKILKPRKQIRENQENQESAVDKIRRKREERRKREREEKEKEEQKKSEMKSEDPSERRARARAEREKIARGKFFELTCFEFLKILLLPSEINHFCVNSSIDKSFMFALFVEGANGSVV